MNKAIPDGAATTLREYVVHTMRMSPQSTLSRTAASVLSHLERKGPLRITTLSELELVTQPAMTGLIQRLEAAALVTRRIDPADGRASLVEITPPGRGALTERRQLHDQAIEKDLSTLDAKQLKLLVAALPALSTLTEN